MPQSKILLDSNTYFRLANSIHPLLDNVFGELNYCLYVLKDLDVEFDRNRRLRTKFSWVDDEEYVSNRRKRLVISRKQKREIELACGYMWQHKIDNKLGVSRIDINCLAHGLILEMPVVTDDSDMLQLAADYGVQNMLKTLELLRLMLDCEYIDMDRIRQVAGYWDYIIDKPGNFRSDFIRLFREPPP